MKAIFVESDNGYLAKNDTDDMSWTPSLDKKIFKLLSCAFGGICVVSRHTYQILPKVMLYDENRQFIVADKAGPRSLCTLNKVYPNAVLIGGPRFLKAAYDLGVIDTFIVTTLNMNIKSKSKYENPFIDVLLKLDASCVINFEEMTIRIYKNEQKY